MLEGRLSGTVETLTELPRQSQPLVGSWLVALVGDVLMRRRMKTSLQTTRTTNQDTSSTPSEAVGSLLVPKHLAIQPPISQTMSAGTQHLSNWDFHPEGNLPPREGEHLELDNTTRSGLIKMLTPLSSGGPLSQSCLVRHRLGSQGPTPNRHLSLGHPCLRSCGSNKNHI